MQQSPRQVLLQPVGSLGHIEDVIQRVKLTPEIRDLLPPDVAEEFADRKEVELWGIRPTPDMKPRSVWRDLTSGAIVVFIEDNQIVRLAEAELTFQAPSLAWLLWSTDIDGRLWWDICVLKSEDLTTPIPFDPTAIDYSPDYIVRGANLLGEEKSAKAWRYIADALASQPATDTERDIDTIANDQALDDPQGSFDLEALWKIVETMLGELPLSRRAVAEKNLVNGRLHQRFESSNDAEQIKEEAGGVCQLCGLPGAKGASGKRRIAIHHIQPRAEGGEDKYGNYLAVCPTCHDMIHFCGFAEIKKHIMAIEKLMDDYPHTEETIKHLLPVSKRLTNARRAARAIGN